MHIELCEKDEISMVRKIRYYCTVLVLNHAINNVHSVVKWFMFPHDKCCDKLLDN